MKKVLMFLVSLCMLTIFTGCCSWCSPEPDETISVEELVSRVKKKNDPFGRADSIHSAVFKYDSANLPEKSKIKIFLKRPGKIKIEIKTGEEFWECAYDGKEAWGYSNADGVRFLTDAESNEIRLQAFLLFPSIDIKKVFSDIKISGSEKIEGEDCWRLLCQPSDEFKSQPLTVFVTKKTYLIVQVIEKQDTNDGVVEVTTLFKEYKKFRGFLLPLITITKVDDDVTESRLRSVYLNKEISDSEFAVPTVFE